MAELTLPTSITGKRELIKVQREIEGIGEQLIQSKISSKEIGKTKEIPGLTKLTNEFLYENKLNIDASNAEEIYQSLQTIRDSAPTIRVSFATEPDNTVTSKLVEWFRREIDSRLLIQIGIQPSIAGGCVIQTPGKRYDFSLRKKILSSQDKFRAVIAQRVFNQKPNNQPESSEATKAGDS